MGFPQETDVQFDTTATIRVLLQDAETLRRSGNADKAYNERISTLQLFAENKKTKNSPRDREDNQ